MKWPLYGFMSRCAFPTQTPQSLERSQRILSCSLPLCKVFRNDPPFPSLAVSCFSGSGHSFSWPSCPDRVFKAKPSNSRPNEDCCQKHFNPWGFKGEPLWTSSDSWVWTKALTQGLASGLSLLAQEMVTSEKGALSLPAGSGLGSA